MFNDIEELTKEIEKFKMNITGSGKLIEALNDIATSFRLQTKKSDNILNEFKENYISLKTQFNDDYNSLLQKQSEISEKSLEKFEETSKKLNLNFIELNQNNSTFFQELINHQEKQMEQNKSLFEKLDSRVSSIKNTANKWVIILSCLGIINIIISIILLIFITK